MQEEVEMRQLKIKTLSDTVYELRVPANMLIKDLRLKVQEVSGVPPDRQRMICMGQQLNDVKTVGDYAKEAEQPNWIHLVAKVQTQTTNATTTNQQAPPQQQQQQQANRNNGPFDMFGGNLQIQSGGVNDLSSLLGNLTNMFNLPQNLRHPQPPQQAQQPQQQPQQAQQQQQQPSTSAPAFQASSSTSSSSAPANVINASSQPRQNPRWPVSNLVGSSQPISISRQIQLPHQELLNLGLICNNLMGQQSSFPGPPLPQLPTRNAASLVGSYLSNWQFQVQRTLPFVHRLAELLQREPYMIIPEDRSSTQALSLEVGRALNELVACTQPLSSILHDLQLNSLPGQIRFDSNLNGPAPVLTRPPPQAPQDQNLPQSQNQGQSSHQGTNISQPTVQASIQISQQPIQQFFQANQGQRNQSSSTNSTNANNTNTNTNNNTNNVNSNPNQQATQQQATINVTQNIQPENGNALNDLLSSISNGQNGEVRIGVMNQSLDNNSEIQIVGIGQTHVVDGDSNINLQSMINNLIGQVGNQNANISINGIRQPAQSNNNNNNNNNTNNRNTNPLSQDSHHMEDEWEDEDDGNAPMGIEVSSTINLNGINPLNGNNNFLQTLLSGLGLPNANVTINSNNLNNASNNNNNQPQVQVQATTTAISGQQAANLLAQMNRQQNGQQNTTSQNQQPQQQQQHQSQPQTQNQSSQQNVQSTNIQHNVPLQEHQPLQQQPQVQSNPLQMMMGGGGGNFNPLSMLMGGGLGGIMNMSVDELIRENMSQQEAEDQTEADELIQSIIGQLRISDLVSSFISGQFGFLDTIQLKIREQITSRNLNNFNQTFEILIEQQFAESLAQSLSQYLVIPQQHQSLVFDGLEPHMIAQDILENRLIVLYEIIFRNFPADGVERFSSEFVYEVKQITGELFSDISECLVGGINDLEKVFRTWVSEPIVRIMGEGSQGLIDTLITSMLWDKVKRIVLTHRHEQENNQRPVEEQKSNADGNVSSSGQMEIERPLQNREEQELDLLEDIENGLEKDQTRFDRYNIQLSQAYIKGDFIKKDN